jgi:hypothetical protein
MTTPDDDTDKFIADLKEAVALASYIEQLLMSEQQWIMNRLSWLFTSQSFLLTAFVVLLNSNNSSPSARLLLFGLPLLGFICCVTVSLAVVAAESVGKPLADRRALLSTYINHKTNSSKLIPMIGATKGLRDQHWTLFFGALPHRSLPGVLAFLWLSLLYSLGHYLIVFCLGCSLFFACLYFYPKIK